MPEITPTTICTISGAHVNLAAPWAGALRLADIAHALGAICRFNGHTPLHYSVAEHSCNVAAALDPADCALYPRLRLWALLHDAHEAYLGDWPTPVKKVFAKYVEDGLTLRDCIEGAFDAAIARALGVAEQRPGPAEVELYHRADTAVLRAEALAFGLELGFFNDQAPRAWQGLDGKGFQPIFLHRDAARAGWLRAVEAELAQLKSPEFKVQSSGPAPDGAA